MTTLYYVHPYIADQVLPIEVCPAGSTTASEQAPPQLFIRWYRVNGASWYLVEKKTAGVWGELGKVESTGQAEYLYFLPREADGDLVELRVSGVAENGEQGGYATFSAVIATQPPVPDINFRYADGTGVLTMEDAHGEATPPSVTGYRVYVGVDALPTLTSPTTTFLTLPHNEIFTFPGLGNRTYTVIVRTYNGSLESQNQYPFTFTIDETGARKGDAIRAPINMTAVVAKKNYMIVRAVYNAARTDRQPPDQWRFWFGATPPNIATDTYVYGSTKSGIITLRAGPLTPGTYYLMLRLYRPSDNTYSPAAELVLEVPAVLPAPVPV